MIQNGPVETCRVTSSAPSLFVATLTPQDHERMQRNPSHKHAAMPPDVTTGGIGRVFAAAGYVAG